MAIMYFWKKKFVPIIAIYNNKKRLIINKLCVISYTNNDIIIITEVVSWKQKKSLLIFSLNLPAFYHDCHSLIG